MRCPSVARFLGALTPALGAARIRCFHRIVGRSHLSLDSVSSPASTRGPQVSLRQAFFFVRSVPFGSVGEFYACLSKHRKGFSESFLTNVAPQETPIARAISRLMRIPKSLPTTLGEKVSFLKKSTSLPVCVGFGISTPEQAGQVASLADGVVVGSAIVDRIAKLGRSPQLIPEITAFLRPIAQAVHSA